MVLVWIIVIGLLVGLIIAGTAYRRVTNIVNKYSQVDCTIGIKCIDFVAKCIQSFDLDCKIALTDKVMSDAYILSKKIIVLNKQTAESCSISAIAISAHEIGHAIQHKNKNFLLRLDMFFRKLYAILKIFVIPVFIAGIVLLFFENLINIGLILLASLVLVWLLSIITRLATIPMEVQASKIAYDILKDNRVLTRAELKQTKKILNAAALTYVGALFINILNLFRKIENSFRR